MNGADETIDTPSPEVIALETEASTMGWTPKDKFRGDPAKWVDAETYVRRGHEVMPLLKKTNQRLEGDLSAAQRELAELRAQADANNQTVKDLVAFQAKAVKDQVDAQLRALKVQKREARKAGDADLVDDIEDQMEELREEAATAPAPVKITEVKKPDPAPGVSPWAKSFADENEWLGKDKRRTALFMGIADELHATGLRERALLDAAKAELEKTLAPPPGPGKTEGHQGGGSGGSGNGSGGSGGGKSFSDLPSDAKAVCKAEARKFVGNGKAFKTEADWQKHYASVYFND